MRPIAAALAGYSPASLPWYARLLAGRRVERMMYCPGCQAYRWPKALNRGSPFTALLLLLLFFPAAAAYEVWRRASRKYVCSACGKGDMVPTHVGGNSAPHPQDRHVCVVFRARDEARKDDIQETPETPDVRGIPDTPGLPDIAGITAASQVPDLPEESRPLDVGQARSADRPVNAVRMIGVPGAQTTGRDVPLVFSRGTGNAISVGDATAGGAPFRVTIRARRGSVRLPRGHGLRFTLGNGRDNFVMQFSGSAHAVNAALDGLRFTPSGRFVGNASLWVGIDEAGPAGGDAKGAKQGQGGGATGSNAAEAGVAIAVVGPV